MRGIPLHSHNVTLKWELSLMVLTAIGDQYLGLVDLYMTALTIYILLVQDSALREYGMVLVAIFVMHRSELLRFNQMKTGIINLSEHVMMDSLMEQIVSTWSHHLGLQPLFGRVPLTTVGCEFTNNCRKNFAAHKLNFKSVIL